MSENKSVERLESVVLKPTSPLRLSVWWVRRTVRDLLGGKDALDVQSKESPSGLKLRKVYRKADEFISDHLPSVNKATPKSVALRRLRDAISELDYHVVDRDETKPWGAYYRMDTADADRFIAEFFPSLDPIEARLGRSDLELSPKFLLVAPGQRLSWQMHRRRAERWRFLNGGAYYKSVTDEQGDRVDAKAGDAVQFAMGERHRLCAYDDQEWTLVAEIWQHVKPNEPSDEADIIRLSDDYSR